MRVIDVKFPRLPFIRGTFPVSLLDLSIRYFDRDGYELTEVERAIHRYFNIPVGDCLNHHSVCSEWITDEDELPIILDHSFILTRYAYDDDAADIIRRKSEEDKRFLKLLSLRPKYGVDISIEYVENDKITELLHIEIDSTNLNGIKQAKSKLEQTIPTLDFANKAKELMKLRSEWENLQSDDQSDYKARFFGFNRAFDNLKAFT